MVPEGRRCSCPGAKHSASHVTGLEKHFDFDPEVPPVLCRRLHTLLLRHILRHVRSLISKTPRISEVAGWGVGRVARLGSKGVSLACGSSLRTPPERVSPPATPDPVGAPCWRRERAGPAVRSIFMESPALASAPLSPPCSRVARTHSDHIVLPDIFSLRGNN